MRFLCIITALLLAVTCPQGQAQDIAINSPVPLSTRVNAYTLDAHVDVNRHTLDATETLVYRNLTGQPLTTFPFHLYLNAFQPDSSFTTETHLGGGIRDSEQENSYPERKRGFITLSRLDVSLGAADQTLLPTLHYRAPDDGNVNDRTVAEVTLPAPLQPGQSATFHISFHDQFPESVARNGYKRDFLMGGQWYPKPGVFWHGAWNCHQYHATTEFFSDFATFNVRLTLPRSYIVGASGVPTGEVHNADGTQTLTFRGEDIHDFAWAASPHFTTTDATYASALGPVKVHVLALAAHPQAGERYRNILLASMRQFEARYGPYPYKILTLVDPEPGSEIGGMEYPTLVTGDASLLDPTLSQELTAEHEFGHQYWYGMVATNEFEDAWLDEGINSYTEVKVLGAVLGPRTSFFNRPWANASDASAQYLEYIFDPSLDPVTRHAWQFRNAASYGGITYGKSATLLATLEGVVGSDVMDEAMRTYFQRFRFQHPTTQDFLGVIAEVAQAHGRGSAASLKPFFDQAVFGTAVDDYSVDAMTNEPLQWWLANGPKTDNDKRLQNHVTVRRIGDFKLPVTLEVVFSDGTRRREHWNPAEPEDGNDRWHTYTYVTTSHVISAEVDPDHTVPLDIDQFNNSKTLAANPIPARKIGNLWLTTLQAASQFAGWLI